MRPQHARTAAVLVFALFLIVGNSVSAFADQKYVEEEFENASKDILHKVMPRYPWLAGEKGHDGYGLYQLNIDTETGGVVSVEVVKTSTHKELDECAIKAFRQWRIRPHTWHAIRVPANFTYRHGKISEARRLAVYAPDPPRPVTWHSGTGKFRFIIDYDTGKVIDVQILQSTGRPSFDKDVVKAYRQWRFLPHKVRSIDTTVGFGS